MMRQPKGMGGAGAGEIAGGAPGGPTVPGPQPAAPSLARSWSAAADRRRDHDHGRCLLLRVEAWSAEQHRLIPTRDLPTPGERPVVTPDQWTRLRHENWRALHDEGMALPGGRVRQLSVREVAQVAGVSKSVVGRGILQARVVQKALADALARRGQAG